jgi:hypothetical protein
MAEKAYSGSCHCGAVRFTARIDLDAGTTRCNCSYCAKVRSWFTLIAPEKLTLVAGEYAQQEYTWVPPGRPAANLHFRFCKTCGVRTPGFGEHGPGGGPFCFIPIALLDDADADALAGGLHYIDGKHDRYDRQPADMRLM